MYISLQCQRIVKSKFFDIFIFGTIGIAAILVGLETHPPFLKQYGVVLHSLDQIVLWIFAIEAAIKITAEGATPWKYFYEPWNIFDFTIVVVCFLPIGAQFVAVLRLARILRILKLVRAIPQLQVLVGALLRSIPSIFYVSILLLLLFYLYAVIGTFLYGENDPVHFGSLFISMISLFRVVTLEDWTDLMYIQMYGCDQYGYQGMMELCTHPKAFMFGSVAFFISFVLLGTMIVINLFIGIIMNSMNEVHEEIRIQNQIKRQKELRELTLIDEIHLLDQHLETIQEKLNVIKHYVKEESKSHSS